LKQYLADPGHCPVCNGTGIEGQEVSIEGSQAEQTVTCVCGAMWVDVYVLDICIVQHDDGTEERLK